MNAPREVAEEDDIDEVEAGVEPQHKNERVRESSSMASRWRRNQ